MDTVNERIQALRAMMKERGIDAYLVPTSDFHESEYVGSHFECRKFITGFTGSAGAAVITLKEAGLWTDGRYFVQAGKQLQGSEVKLFKMGQEGVPTIEEYLAENMPENGVLGFDGRVVNEEFGEELLARLQKKNVTAASGEDLIGALWTERPSLPAEKVWVLDVKYAGKSAKDKIADLREAMKKNRATVHILTTLDDIVWLLNIRGNDVPCNPVVLSYAVVTEDKFFLFINDKTLDSQTKAYLEGLGVKIKPYDDIYVLAKTFRNERILLEKSRVNFAVCQSLDESNEIVNQMNPTASAKAVKNPVEMENMRKAHIKDAVAMIRHLRWMKENIGTLDMDEMSVQRHLDQLRFDTEGNLGLSFGTISAYGENAALCHYSATPETNKKLEPRGLYLVDSGGQYYEGTTDITRTIALGPVTEEEKKCFTLVAACMLRLLNVRCPYGCHGYNFDFAARELLWREGLDFNHGTGHGVGYLLNVHERPNGVRWRVVPERQDNAVFEEGMVTSDEPGLYFEGKFGVRTENLMLCVKDVKNEYGQFMKFENLTWVPIDRDAIDTRWLEKRDLELLNEYHRQVYEVMAPHLSEEDRSWLEKVTAPIA